VARGLTDNHPLLRLAAADRPTDMLDLPKTTAVPSFFLNCHQPSAGGKPQAERGFRALCAAGRREQCSLMGDALLLFFFSFFPVHGPRERGGFVKCGGRAPRKRQGGAGPFPPPPPPFFLFSVAWTRPRSARSSTSVSPRRDGVGKHPALLGGPLSFSFFSPASMWAVTHFSVEPPRPQGRIDVFFILLLFFSFPLPAGTEGAGTWPPAPSAVRHSQPGRPPFFPPRSSGLHGASPGTTPKRLGPGNMVLADADSPSPFFSSFPRHQRQSFVLATAPRDQIHLLFSPPFSWGAGRTHLSLFILQVFLSVARRWHGVWRDQNACFPPASPRPAQGGHLFLRLARHDVFLFLFAGALPAARRVPFGG